jgi:hypothetical protein
VSLPAAFASIAQGMSAAFGAPYHDGFIVTQTAPVYDDGGSIVTPGGVDKAPCRVQIDDATEYMRAQEGFADGEVVFVILSASIGVGSLTGQPPVINTDAVVTIPNGPRAGTWQVATLGRDPAGIGWSGKGRRRA